MQVDCFGFKWEEVKKRPSAEAVVEEMIFTDDIDIYSISLPDGIWKSDSARQYFEVAMALDRFIAADGSADFSGVEAVASLISEGKSIDEIGLSSLTDGCYFISISPERISGLREAFNNMDLGALSERCSEFTELPSAEIEQWLGQWKMALDFAGGKGVGLIGHCG